MHLYFNKQTENATSSTYIPVSAANGTTLYVSGAFGADDAAVAFEWSFDGINNWVAYQYNGSDLSFTEPGQLRIYGISGVYTRCVLTNADVSTEITVGISPS